MEEIEKIEREIERMISIGVELEKTVADLSERITRLENAGQGDDITEDSRNG